MFTSWEVDNETMAGVGQGKLPFSEVIKNDILRMQDTGITSSNDTKNATKLGMKVFRDKHFFNAQLAPKVGGGGEGIPILDLTGMIVVAFRGN